MVHYELGPEVPRATSSPDDRLEHVTIFDRALNQVQHDHGTQQHAPPTGCLLTFVESLEIHEQELKDSLKLHQAFLSNSQASELDTMY